ncbi:hypothetical protein AAC387_Pa01g0587 [Persea americana]
MVYLAGRRNLSIITVVPVIFQNTLRQSKRDPVLNLDCIFRVEPMQITSPTIDSDVTLALRVLEGCCLLNKESNALAHQQKAINVYNFLGHSEETEQLCFGPCDSLLPPRF